ncbi:MAG: hypothetical protein ABSD98_13445 [Candidatus Korobacteraceae bacterium]|jgi:hypothetical protein
MTIHLELNLEFVERLSAEAKARGLGVEQYAETLLREAIASRSEPGGHLSVGELHAMLAAVAEGSDRLPRVPTSSFTRESFYDGRF